MMAGEELFEIGIEVFSPIFKPNGKLKGLTNLIFARPIK